MTSRLVRPALVAVSLIVALLVAAGCSSGGGAWWGLREEVGPESTVVPITVRIGSSSCHRFNGVTTHETDESVTITATVRRIGDGDCTADLGTEAVDVTLSGPLGDRTLGGCRHTDERPCDEVIAAPSG